MNCLGVGSSCETDIVSLWPGPFLKKHFGFVLVDCPTQNQNTRFDSISPIFSLSLSLPLSLPLSLSLSLSLSSSLFSLSLSLSLSLCFPPSHFFHGFFSGAVPPPLLLFSFTLTRSLAFCLSASTDFSLSSHSLSMSPFLSPSLSFSPSRFSLPLCTSALIVTHTHLLQYNTSTKHHTHTLSTSTKHHTHTSSDHC